MPFYHDYNLEKELPTVAAQDLISKLERISLTDRTTFLLDITEIVSQWYDPHIHHKALQMNVQQCADKEYEHDLIQWDVEEHNPRSPNPDFYLARLWEMYKEAHQSQTTLDWYDHFFYVACFVADEKKKLREFWYVVNMSVNEYLQNRQP